MDAMQPGVHSNHYSTGISLLVFSGLVTKDIVGNIGQNVLYKARYYAPLIVSMEPGVPSNHDNTVLLLLLY